MGAGLFYQAKLGANYVIYSILGFSGMLVAEHCILLHHQLNRLCEAVGRTSLQI